MFRWKTSSLPRLKLSEHPAGSGRTYFISDLHLTDQRPDINGRFFHFIEAQASGADALYILGDLFEYWVGDDNTTSPIASKTASRLRVLTQAGTPVYFMHGNRDFLLASKYAAQSGMSLLPDPTLISLYGIPTLLMHGDTLCTDDRDYQSFRTKLRRPWVQALLLALPLAVRQRLAGLARAGSESAKQNKPEEIMDVSQAEVARVLQAHGYPRLIHGHTHRPARHVHEVDGQSCERWVLPDWYQSGGYVECDQQDCRLVIL
jgi:UDP-2,3-diacylglucosamine hydrolase